MSTEVAAVSNGHESDAIRQAKYYFTYSRDARLQCREIAGDSDAIVLESAICPECNAGLDWGESGETVSCFGPENHQFSVVDI